MLIKKLIIKTRMITAGDHRHGLQIERSDSLPSELPDELKLAGNYWNLPIRSQSKSRPVKIWTCKLGFAMFSRRVSGTARAFSRRSRKRLL